MRLELKYLIIGLFMVFQYSPLSSKDFLKTSPSSKIISLRQQIGQMIMVGFEGVGPQDPEVQAIAGFIEKGLVGGVILFGYNIKNPTQVKRLTGFLKSIPAPLPLLIAVDQEGGKVQRLNSKNGFLDFLSAQKVSKTFSPQEAIAYYERMAKMVKEADFNTVFGPVVDLENLNGTGPMNPVIGKLERSFSSNPSKVADYGASFIKAHHRYGLLTSLKHFPGHGLAGSDSHIDLVDITKTFDPQELKPYSLLFERGLADMVMVGHLMMQQFDTHYPATLSPIITKKLLREKGYQGVVITDDLFMGAIQKNFEFKDIILAAVEADMDILLFSLNKAAQKGVNEEDLKKKQKATEDLIPKIIEVIEDGIESGRFPVGRLEASYKRIQGLKSRLGQAK